MDIIMKRYITYIFAGALIAFGATACVNDLNVTPIDPNLSLLDDPDYLFNKCYGTMAMAGNSSGDGSVDVEGIDGGTSGYVRQYWNSNELTTDEAICGWGDEGISAFCFNSYDASHPMLRGLYYRLYTAITYCNHYLEVAGDLDAVKAAEIRFLRAFHYHLAMDAFGNIPFVTAIISEKPQQASRADVFSFIESELLEIESQLSEPKVRTSADTGYGRVDKAAAWLLLSRIYLNAEVYTGTARWADAAAYAKKVIDSPYGLNVNGSNGYSAYEMLFMGNNGETSATVEAVFPILQDGKKTASWGASLFLIASTAGGDFPTGTSESWNGNRARPDLVAKFFPNGNAPEADKYGVVRAAGDDRALFHSVGRRLDNADVGTYEDGFAVAKFSNIYTDGSAGHDDQYVDMDFFLMRAAEAWLTYAEAVSRQNGGSVSAEAVSYLNELRSRAHASIKTSWTLDDICDEWSREFFFEGRRRVDLIRFGKFGGSNYAWRWKGGVYEGASFPATRNIFAIPTSDLTANENLVQNPGY